MDAMRSSSCGRMMGGGSVSLKVVREKKVGRKKCDAVDAPRG